MRGGSNGEQVLRRSIGKDGDGDMSEVCAQKRGGEAFDGRRSVELAICSSGAGRMALRGVAK